MIMKKNATTERMKYLFNSRRSSFTYILPSRSFIRSSWMSPLTKGSILSFLLNNLGQDILIKNLTPQQHLNKQRIRTIPSVKIMNSTNFDQDLSSSNSFRCDRNSTWKRQNRPSKSAIATRIMPLLRERHHRQLWTCQRLTLYGRDSLYIYLFSIYLFRIVFFYIFIKDR